MSNQNNCSCGNADTDFGPEPFVTNINCAARKNCDFRTALWTGTFLQCTLMSIPACGETGLEVFADADQFLHVEEGCGCAMMGSTSTRLNFQTSVSRDSAIFVPAGTWFNLVNTGNCPLKLFSIIAPPQFTSGTLQTTAASSNTTEMRYTI